MTTFTSLHADLEAAYTRTTRALNALAQQLEALPGSEAAKPANPKPAKPKGTRKPKPAAMPSRNGQAERFPVNDVPGAGF